MSNENNPANAESRFLFFKPEGFYRMVIPQARLNDYINGNPSALRVIDVSGTVIWTRAEGYLEPTDKALSN